MRHHIYTHIQADPAAGQDKHGKMSLTEPVIESARSCNDFTKQAKVVRAQILIDSLRNKNNGGKK
ncbi:hypothetical protein [Desulfomicrobium salsuginis]